MAKILVVDDQQSNRQFLVKLLGYGGHQLLEAGDGVEALRLAQTERPDLVISDILMPRMDGFEFVRHLRENPATANTPVIFYTATYHQREARTLAESCGVRYLLTKPSRPEVILRTVSEALGGAPPIPLSVSSGDRFQREHTALLTDTLAEKVSELEATNERLAALIELGQQLTLERNPERLLRRFCEAARKVVAARFAAIGLLSAGGESFEHFLCSGQEEGRDESTTPSPVADPLKQLLSERAPLRLTQPLLDPGSLGLARAPSFGHSFLGTAVTSSHRVYGVLYMVDRLGADEFGEADESLLVTLAAQFAVAYENARLFSESERQYQRLSALRAIDLTILSSLDRRVAFNAVLDQTSAQLGADAAAILLLNPQTRHLEYAAGRGFRSRGIEQSVLRPGDGHAGAALLQRRAVTDPDLGVSETPFARTRLAGEGFRSYICAPLIVRGEPRGVLESFHRTRLTPDADWLNYLEALAGQVAIALDNAELFRGLQQTNAELALAYDATLEGWVHALDLRDKETEGHTRRVTDMTVRLARHMGQDEAALTEIRRGALLHDIGKIGVPDYILLKPGPLTDDEWVVMRKHPIYAHEMLSGIRYLSRALDIPYCHHEKWDGTGYPRGLKGEQIPLAARIFAVVDVWDALSSDRPYRKAWSRERVRDYIRSLSGTHSDPQVVVAFLELDEQASRAGGSE